MQHNYVHAPRPVLKKGRIFTFGKYQGEPVEWLVLDVDREENKALVISRYIADYDCYDEGTAEWEYSHIRSRLKRFHEEWFSDAERALILYEMIPNFENPDFLGIFEPDTMEYLFLLNYDDAVRYFPSASERVSQDSPDGSAEAWWLRTQGDCSSTACVVETDGNIFTEGYPKYKGLGMRPAMWILCENEPRRIDELQGDVQPGDEIIFGTYGRKTMQTPLVWQVMDVKRREKKMLLLSKSVLAILPYDCGNDHCVWTEADIRRVMNENRGEAFFASFREDEWQCIEESTLQTMGRAGSCEKTQDRFFLLNLEEAERYMPVLRQRAAMSAEGVAFAYTGADGQEKLIAPGNIPWWLRSAGLNKNGVSFVSGTGYLEEDGVDKRNYMGVRPAVWVSYE